MPAFLLSMAKTRKRKVKSRSKKQRRKSVGILKRGLIWLSTITSFLLLTWLGYLDYTVRHQFEGKRWALPAQVYATPLELYAGLELGSAQLASHLDSLRYRKRNNLSQQATYLHKKQRVDFYLRNFQFWDKTSRPQKIRVLFSGNHISSISSLNQTRTISMLRLDPQLIGNFYPTRKEDRVLIKLEQAPQNLLSALTLIEDRHFYDHLGVSPKGILRALWANLRAGKIVQGGSTLTQQLVKNFYLTPKRSLWRKVNEALMALLLEAHYGKDEILEAYLNEIYLGQDGERAIHGFGLASEHYFSQRVEDIKLHQAALLVAIVRGPSFYNPTRHPRQALDRRNRILGTMRERDIITEKQFVHAIKQPLDVTPPKKRTDRLFPAFMDLVRRQLLQEYREKDLTSEGLRIFTMLDVAVQKQAEKAVKNRVSRLESAQKLPKRSLESAVVVTRREGGEVVAMVGGSRVKYAGFNRALDAVRPIGSLIKPVVYLAAIASEQYTVTSLLEDKPISLKTHDGAVWAPQNYDRKSHGVVPLHRALAHSYNLASVRLGLDVGVDQVIRTLNKMGVRRPLKSYPSLLLGAAALTPFEVAQLYQTFAGDCFVAPLRSIQAVLSSQGEALQRYPLTVRQVADPAACYIVNSILQEVVREGTGKSVNRWLPSQFNTAGKTGTTNDLRDSWFAGFTGDYLTVVWLGRDDNKPARLTGASGALQLWGETMRTIARQPVDLIKPDNVEKIWIDPENGLQADQYCLGATSHPFIKGTEPAKYSSCVRETNRLDRWLGRVLN